MDGMFYRYKGDRGNKSFGLLNHQINHLKLADQCYCTYWSKGQFDFRTNSCHTSKSAQIEKRLRDKST